MPKGTQVTEQKPNVGCMQGQTYRYRKNVMPPMPSSVVFLESYLILFFLKSERDC